MLSVESEVFLMKWSLLIANKPYPHKVWSTSNFCHSIFNETVNISCICRVAFVWTKSQCKSQSSSKALPCVEAGGPKCISRSCLSTKNCVLVWNFPMYICEYSQFSYCFIFFSGSIIYIAICGWQLWQWSCSYICSDLHFLSLFKGQILLDEKNVNLSRIGAWGMLSLIVLKYCY